MHIFRKQNRIKVYGDNVPWPITSFKQLEDKFNFKVNCSHKTPTPIQLQAIPIALNVRNNINRN